jgi:hypothetical protein
MEVWADLLSSINLVSVILVGTILISLYYGIRRGASSSAGRLFFFILEGVLTIVSILASWKLAVWLSPIVQEWFISLDIEIPASELGMFEQLYYTLVTSIRDFSLLRYGIIIILGYALMKSAAYLLVKELFELRKRLLKKPLSLNVNSPAVNGIVGGAIGSILGMGRSLILIAILFIYVSLYPQAPFVNYIQASSAYQKGAEQVIQPVTGDFFEQQFPVFTRAVEAEFSKILQRKYEIIDYNIPENIAAAAKQITSEAVTDEEKARALYQWVGTRIQYDWEKVRLYEEEKHWKEQTPEDTFASRMGVCIDYSRLYAVMARAVDLEVAVITGLGYDGRGGYGPHAWNEVYLQEEDRWIPLDTTWVSGGGDWFDPPHFEESHVKDA